MTTYRMFSIEDGHRSCVRIFKLNQLVGVKAFMYKYCRESGNGSIVELIKYQDGQLVELVARLKKR